MNARTLRSLLLAAMAVAIGACSGGTGGTGAVSYGAITGFGSVFVNGVEFNTSGTTITMDGTSATQSALRIGMVVTVSGSISGATGTASRIKVDGAVKGYIESVTDANHIVVMGQTVLIDNQTSLENFTAPRAAGDFVSVHGHVTGNGVIAAGFIEKKSAPVPFAVKGFVQSHSTATQTFQIGTLTVNYSGAIIGDMPNPAGDAWNGLLVEVKGSTCTGNPVCGTLTATKVEPSGLTVTEAMEAEVEGFVTDFTSSSSFKIGTQAVVTNGATVFEGGLASDIALGVKLEVEGVLSAGVLTARKISFRDNIRFEANVDTLGTDSLTLAGLPGITVTANSLTKFKGAGGLVAFAGLASGNHLRIRGRVTSGTPPVTVVATEIERLSVTTNDRVSLQGPVGSAVDPNVTILGVTVDTTGIIDADFRDVNDSPIGRTAFFAAAAPNVLVKARGTLVGASVTWDQIELED